MDKPMRRLYKQSKLNEMINFVESADNPRKFLHALRIQEQLTSYRHTAGNNMFCRTVLLRVAKHDRLRDNKSWGHTSEAFQGKPLNQTALHRLLINWNELKFYLMAKTLKKFLILFHFYESLLNVGKFDFTKIS